MRLRLLALAMTTTALAACAEGDTITGAGGNDGSGGTAQNGGNTTGGGTKSGPTTTGSSQPTTTTGEPCSEQPCKLVEPQCGCPDGEACSIDGANERACVEAGSVAWGAPCDAGQLCAPGLMCVGYATGKLSCAKFCDTDAECEAPGGLCAINLDDGNGGDVPNVALCSDDCNLVTNAGCQVAGTSCQIGLRDMTDPFTLCAPSGTGVQDTMCTDNTGCAPGFICLTTTAMDERCFQWCDVANPTCPGGLVCQQLEISAGVPLVIGSTSYGACT
jgi:hypothetical protein